MVGGVVRAGGLPLPAVIFQVDLAWPIDPLLGVPAPASGQHLAVGPGRLTVRNDLFRLFALNYRHLLRSDTDFELQQPLIYGAKLPHSQRLVVDEHQVVALVILVSGQQVQSLG
jgi:hypothetical protein